MLYENLAKEHRGNIALLRDGLIDMYCTVEYHPNFVMESFQSQSTLITEHTCSTSACVAGHGPIFGIGKFNGNWSKYAEQSFGLSSNSLAFDFLFGNLWSNNIREAIARLDLFISGFDAERGNWFYDVKYTSPLRKLEQLI